MATNTSTARELVSRYVGPVEPCSICNKVFAKESTRKRHFYYCRSKRPYTNASRRKSCVACVRAKTRCSWMTSPPAGEACARCEERGVECDYGGETRLSAAVSRRDMWPPSQPMSAGLASAGVLSVAAAASSSSSSSSSSSGLGLDDGGFNSRAGGLPLSSQVQPFPSPTNDKWDSGISDVGGFDLDAGFAPTTQAPNPLPDTMYSMPDILVTGMTSLQGDAFQQLPPPRPFKFRTFRKPGQAALVSIAARIMRSYPFMMLQPDNFPPFVSRQFYTWAKTKEGPPQKALMNCVALVGVFKLRTEANKHLVWNLIRSEFERISAEYLEFDQWELLAALQALLLYCLLRLHDETTGQDDFDVMLLKTINLVSNSLSLLIKCDCSLPDDPRLKWQDWLFNESRRRTALILRAVNMLVDISSAISCFPATDFNLIPLPNKTTLWASKDLDKWTDAFAICTRERTLFGLSEAGSLARLVAVGSEIKIFSAEWDEWAAEVGEIATLVMVLGELLH